MRDLLRDVFVGDDYPGTTVYTCSCKGCRDRRKKEWFRTWLRKWLVYGGKPAAEYTGKGEV